MDEGDGKKEERGNFFRKRRRTESRAAKGDAGTKEEPNLLFKKGSRKMNYVEA